MMKRNIIIILFDLNGFYFGVFVIKYGVEWKEREK